MMYDDNNIFFLDVPNSESILFIIQSIASIQHLNLSDDQLSITQDHKRILFYLPNRNKLGSDLNPQEFAEFFLSLPLEIQDYLLPFVVIGYMPDKSLKPPNSIMLREKTSQKNSLGSISDDHFQEHIVQSLNSAQTIQFYHNHYDISTYLILAKALPMLKANGLVEVHIELPSYAAILLEFFNITREEKYWKLVLKFHPLSERAVHGMNILARSASENQIKLIPVDNPIMGRILTSTEHMEQVHLRTQFLAMNIIDRAQKFLPEQKAIGLFGLEHHEISQLVSEMSHNSITSTSYGLLSTQLCHRDLHLWQQKLNLFDNAKNCEYFFKIPNYINQKNDFYSLQQRLKCTNYLENTLKYAEKLCFFPCEIIYKKFVRKNEDKREEGMQRVKTV